MRGIACMTILDKSRFSLELFSHYSSHITRSQFEMEAGLMKELFLLSRKWIDKKVLLKWKLGWQCNS